MVFDPISLVAAGAVYGWMHYKNTRRERNARENAAHGPPATSPIHPEPIRRSGPVLGPPIPLLHPSHRVAPFPSFQPPPLQISDPTEAEPFQSLERGYAEYPISKAVIRVLVPIPSDDIPSFSMKTLKIDPLSEPYEALSYVCGEKSGNKTIRLDDMEWPVTDNLYDALEALDGVSGRSSQLLWVDQLCINTSNPTSAAEAVKSMHIVYRKAARVNIWFGKADEHSDRAIQFFDQPRWKHGTDRSLLGIYSANIYNPTRNPWLDLGQGLLLRPWWRRVWVIQEAMLAKHPVVFCGLKTIDFTYLLKLVALAASAKLQIVRPGASTDPLAGNPQLRQHGYYQFPIEALRSLHARHQSGTDVGFMEWLATFHTQDSKLDHDRIYGLFGLADPTTYADMDIDYKGLTVSEAYERATACILKARGNEKRLDFIFLGRGDNRLPGLPSWVPDFRLRPGTRYNYFPLNYLAKFPFKASSEDSKHFVSVSNDRPAHLRVRGIRVGTVERVSCVNDVEEKAASEGYDFTQESPFVREAKELCTFAANKRNLPHNALSRTLMCDMLSSGIRLKADQGYFQLPSEIPVPDGYNPVVEPLARVQAWWHELHEAKYRWTRGRRFMVLDNGLIGVGPNEVRVGDVVYVLAGASVPAVLRPGLTYRQPLEFQCVGESYVHERMDGEMIEVGPEFQQIELV